MGGSNIPPLSQSSDRNAHKYTARIRPTAVRWGGGEEGTGQQLQSSGGREFVKHEITKKRGDSSEELQLS